MLRRGGAWRVAKWQKLLPEVAAFEPELEKLDDRALRKRSLSLKFRAKSGEKLFNILPEAYALCREAGKRALQMRHFDVQILGGIAMFRGCCAEMQTGEGKTLTATLPMYLHALTGKGSHLATVNDYLAERDAEWMTPIYNMLGMTVGIIKTDDQSDQRRESYACDITYGTAKEFGFDFMRDRLLLRRLGKQAAGFVGEGSSHRWDESGDKPVQRGMHFALVDEADCILIDEARTPLIIGTYSEKEREKMVATYEWCAEHAPRFARDEHYTLDEDTRKLELTPEGRQLLRAIPQPQTLSGVGLVDLYQFMERAIKVADEFILDRQYIVKDGEIVIVDEFTGRLAEGRKWRDGIHQAIEAKEKIEVTLPTGQAARITMQDLVLRYRHLGGMTGTAVTSDGEFRKIYKMPVVQIPTNRPCVRVGLPDMVFGSMDDKWEAIAKEVKQLHSEGRPVLIGTRSIDKSEALAKTLTAEGIPHEVLNANEIAREAEIVAEAGQRGKVTVSTNMAGRGTDIKLGEGIAEIGGLQVICTELHDAARIDRQLIGRCARQGDPGTYRQYLSLDDDILKAGLGADKAEKLKSIGEGKDGEISQYLKYFRGSQRKIEKRYFRDRNVLLHQERERNKMQREMGQDPYLDSAD